jgi:hypothetical protein
MHKTKIAKSTNDYIKGGNSASKAWKRYIDLLKNEDFQKQIQAMRKRWDVPNEGYEFSEPLESLPFLTKPKEWHGDILSLSSELLELAHKFGFYGSIHPTPLELYFFYNMKERPSFTVQSWQVCRLKGLKYKKKNLPFCVSIEIGPYASQRDILQFVKDNFSKKIEPILLRHANKNIGSTKHSRTKVPKNEERDELIWANRDLSLAMIVKEMSKHGYDVLDQGLITRVLSTQRLKRRPKK